MGAKRLLFRSEAREKLLRGATALADAVRVTLGPRSKSVLVERRWGIPLVCNDGVTIAKDVELEDPEENLGARMLRQAAERTGDAVGDGTSTATVIAHAIYAEGVKNVAAGAVAIEIKRGLERALAAAQGALRALSRPVRSSRERAQVATISAHNDESIGKLVAEALEKVGPDGAISVEEAKGIETQLEVIAGMRFDRGYASHYFVTDPEKMTATLVEPLILLHDRKISRIQDLVTLLEGMAKEGRPLVVIAEEIEGDALATLVVNKLRGVLPCVAVKAPGYGERRKELLDDIAVLTGGRVVAEELGSKLESTTAGDLGRADRVVVDKEGTTIVGGRGDPNAVAARCAELRKRIAEARSDYDREKLEERLAKLAGGVAVIRVGAASEAELKSRKEAMDDAISATKAAIAEGIVPGGGLALLRTIDAVEAEAKRLEGDSRTGALILRRALESPSRQIAENSAADPGVCVDRMRSTVGNFGFDAATGRFVDLIEAGIIDPTKVVRTALENAVSVAGTLLLTEATLTEIPSKEQSPRGAGAESAEA
jgi:chaperonin GroEL